MSSVKQFDHLRIPLDDIKLATNNFADSNLIGEGGFGNVYKGELVHGGEKNTVAVKLLNKKLGQGTPEYLQEISVLSRYKHTNLVSLLGFSDDGGVKTLVYKYLPKKSLDWHLKSPKLSWIERLSICIGAAQGLEHLHNPSSSKIKHRVLHCDIKSANILLDANWDAKISDLGFSKLALANQGIPYIISQPMGTLGYVDPVFVETALYHKESDIYSFGIVLFEVLTGMQAGRVSLPQLAQDNAISTIVLDCLQEQISPCCLNNFAKIAFQCLHRDLKRRPTISEIVNELKSIRLRQVSFYLEFSRFFFFGKNPYE